MDDLLEQGVNSFKAGDKETARRLFISATKQSPDNERAWGWLYNVCKTDKERIQCLSHITRINPGNLKAKELLDKLIASEEPPLIQPVKQVVQKPVTSSPQIQHLQRKDDTPWYRSTLAYLLFFLFITPLWVILIFTDKKQESGVKIVAGLICIAYLFLCCFSPSLLNLNSNTSSVDTGVWVPSGFEQWNNDIAYRYVERACSIGLVEACAHYEVFTRYGCPNSLYVEVAFMSSNGTQVDWSNDIATSLSPGTRAILEFYSFESSAQKVHITKIECY